MKITKELAKFNNIKFHDKEHIYYLDGVKTKSVTSVIGKYKHPFDKDFWSKKKADERGITKDEILKEIEMGIGNHYPIARIINSNVDTTCILGIN